MNLSKYRLTSSTPFDKLTGVQNQQLVNFLHKHLEQYGDEKNDILQAVNFSMKEIPSFGGFVLRLFDGKEIIGAVVVNQTGMGGYIPENILVYIAVHGNYRGQGIGKFLMQAAIKQAKGDIALHVEADNPARFLYEKVGFENKYLEMRLKKSV